ncbi:MAG: fatty acid desaturase family protein [Chitinophagales bacterium]|nr:fatty acid desaturase family protein [Bacteroidota bacterium]
MKRMEQVDVSLADIKLLSNLNPIITISRILLEYILIIGCIFIHKSYHFIWIYVIVWMIISTRLYALYSILHDAIHFSISRNKLWNDLIAQLLLGLPLLVYIPDMRNTHMEHHKHLQTKDDPEISLLSYKEFQFPLKKWIFFKISLLDICGFNFFYYKIKKMIYLILNFSFDKLRNNFDLLLLIGLTLLSYITGYLNDYFLYFLFPFASIYQWLNRIRISTEHFNLDNKNKFRTRTVIPSFLERAIFTPYNLGYHTEHHLYPSVPFYNLPKLHNLLKKDGSFISQTQVYNSYSKVFKEFIK